MADFQIPDKDLLTSVDRAADSFLIYDNSALGLKRTTVDYALDLTSHPVGIDDTQTLTLKTLTAPTISSPVLSGTITGTYTLGGTPTFPAAVVTLTGTQTLTNKTLTSPTINTATITNPTLAVDAISEFTAANGVTIDGLNIKDSKVGTNGVNTASIEALAVTEAKMATAVTWWTELARTTLTVAGDTISVTGISARRHIKLRIIALDTGGTISVLVRFNNDSSTSYAIRVASNGGADVTAVSQTSLEVSPSTIASPVFAELNVIDIATTEKLVTGDIIARNAAGAASIPNRREFVGKWVNTSDQITRVDIINGGTGDFAIGSEVVVLGHDS